MARTRTFVLLGWDAAVGATTLPVGALAVDDRDGRWSVAWTPRTHAAANAWRETVAGCADVPAAVPAWLAGTGTRQLQQVDPPAAGDAATAAATTLESTLTYEATR